MMSVECGGLCPKGLRRERSSRPLSRPTAVCCCLHPILSSCQSWPLQQAPWVCVLGWLREPQRSDLAPHSSWSGAWDWAPKDGMVGELLVELGKGQEGALPGAASLARPVPERKVSWRAGPLVAWGDFKRGHLQGSRRHGEVKPLPWKPFLCVSFVCHVE